MKKELKFEDVKCQIEQMLESLNVAPPFDSEQFVECLYGLGEQVYAHTLDSSQSDIPIQEAKSAARRAQSLVTGFTVMKFAESDPAVIKSILADLPVELSDTIEHNAQMIKALICSTD